MLFFSYRKSCFAHISALYFPIIFYLILFVELFSHLLFVYRCGKSTRVPSFIYEHYSSINQPCKIYITQPRRLAVVNLKTRLQSIYGKEVVGMRMGHGIREDNHNSTAITFVTTGYLVRLLAHHPYQFLGSGNTTGGGGGGVTHIILDEVHERSIDNDLLIYLLKKYMFEFPKIRIILMSATLQGSLYTNYFSFGGKLKVLPPLSGKSFAEIASFNSCIFLSFSCQILCNCPCCYTNLIFLLSF